LFPAGDGAAGADNGGGGNAFSGNAIEGNDGAGGVRAATVGDDTRSCAVGGNDGDRLPRVWTRQLRRAASRRPDGVTPGTAPALHLAVATGLGSLAEASQWMSAPQSRAMAYRRHGNPTVAELEAAIGALEGGAFVTAVGSGMAACLLAVTALVQAGDHVVLPRNAFYETGDQLQHLSRRMGWTLQRVAAGSTRAVVEAITPRTALVLVESPANPSLDTLDLPRLAAACRSHSALLLVDNTVLTAAGQDPMSLGADLTLYSLGKHLNGHGDVMGGLLCTRNPDLHALIEDWRPLAGIGLDPHSAWLALRSLQTLHLRLQQHARTARMIGRMLDRRHPWLHWRGAWCGPHARINGVDASLQGGNIALMFDDATRAACFVEALDGIRVGPTFGISETLVYPYGSLLDGTADDFAANALPPGLVRLAVGLEDPRDLCDELDAALRACRRLTSAG